MQLLQVVVPSLEKLQKEGEVGQARITQYTRYLTVGLAFAQSIGYVFLFKSFQAQAGTSAIANFTVTKVFLIVISLTAGTVLLMWMGELITQRGIGNGISLMIFASIVSRVPSGINAWWTNPNQVFKVVMPFIVVAVVAAVVFVQEGQRRIPVQYAKRVIGRRMTQGGQTYLPLRVNMAGVIPVIFAASVMAIPADRRAAVREEQPAELRLPDLYVLRPWQLALRVRRVPADHPVHLLLHGGHVQPRRPGREPEEIRRVHTGGEARQTHG
jgi:preprotein translocase subunit SecY